MIDGKETKWLLLIFSVNALYLKWRKRCIILRLIKIKGSFSSTETTACKNIGHIENSKNVRIITVEN
jgi:hypothetical protein